MSIGVDREERQISRLGGFIDAVFAIAITLPIVQLEAPKVGQGGSLESAYAKLQPDLLAYILGFVVIGLFWNCSHFGAKILVKSDQIFNLLTIMFLASVSLTPFPARPFVEHARDSSNSVVATQMYAFALAVPIVMWFLRWSWGVSRGLYDPGLTLYYVRALTARYAAAMTAALSGVVVVMLTRHLVIGSSLVGVATASFLVPPDRPFWSWSGTAPAAKQP